MLDEYPQRFRRLRDAQVGWVKAHGTKVSGYCPYCRGGCEFGPQTPPAPTRIPAPAAASSRRVRIVRLPNKVLVRDGCCAPAADRQGIEQTDRSPRHGSILRTCSADRILSSRPCAGKMARP
jgi:hypothetical protein